jgi:hypothetical protein
MARNGLPEKQKAKARVIRAAVMFWRDCQKGTPEIKIKKAGHVRLPPSLAALLEAVEDYKRPAG